MPSNNILLIIQKDGKKIEIIMINKNTGRLGENMAAEYLRTNGYHILRRNYHVRGGEIDIIAKQNQTLVFIEVKTRRQNAGGYPEEAGTPKKLKRTVKNERLSGYW